MLRKKERQDETQFITKILSFTPRLNANVLSCMVFFESHPVYDQTQGSGAVFVLLLRIILVCTWNQTFIPTNLQRVCCEEARGHSEFRRKKSHSPPFIHPCLSHKALETRRTQGLHRKTTTRKKTTDIIARVAQEIIIIIFFFFFFVSSVLFLKETSLRTFLSQSTTMLLLDLKCFFSFLHLAAGVHFCRVGALEEERWMARNTRR